MTEVDDFRRDLLESVRAHAGTTGAYERESFIKEACERLVIAEELSDWTPCWYNDRGYRRRELLIDGFLIDDVDLDASVSIVIGDYRGGDETESLSIGEATLCLDKALNFVEDAYSGRLHDELEPSTPSCDLARWLFDNQSAINCIRLILVTDSALTARKKELAPKTTINTRVEHHIWDIVRFQRTQGSDGREPIDIDLNEFVNGGIRALRASFGATGYDAFLCAVPGRVIADLYDRYGSRLLEGNVRSFLSVKGGVNKGIRNTILKEPTRFFAYNNGITATASQATVVERDGMCRIEGLRDLQIVNGGQTTASLFTARRKDGNDLDRIFVQMKLSVVTADQSVELIPNISRYANSQNKVTEADLFSNHPFHLRVEEQSRRIWAPPSSGAQHQTHWFYERARGQYLNEQVRLTKSKQKEFLLQNPKAQLLTKTDLGKVENSWRRLPHIVSRGAQKNFKEFADWIANGWETDNTHFNDLWFQHAVAKAIIFSATEGIVSTQSWYSGGYRANIVTYAVAKLALVIEREGAGGGLDLDAIWKRQRLSPALTTQITVLAKQAHDVIVNPPEGIKNVTEWCKREACWTALSNLPSPLRAELKSELVDPERRVEAVRQARKTRQVDDELDNQKKVMSVGPHYWERLLTWELESRCLGELEVDLLKLAVRMGSRFAPSPKQAAVLVRAMDTATNEGFG